jgi:hypothetical protein
MIARATEIAIIMRRNFGSRSNPRVAWIVNGAIRKRFSGGLVSMA